MRDELRSMIRELLAEELAAAGVRSGRSGAAPKRQIREEFVSIGSDADLTAFVRKILDISKDGKARAEIEAGRHVFRLQRGGAGGAQTAYAPPAVMAAAPVRFDRGLITEREITRLDDNVSIVQAGKRVRFTPLAQDEMRRRGIKIERAKS